MVMTDPIADLLTRIRNANAVRHETVEIPSSNVKKALANILLQEGYVKEIEEYNALHNIDSSSLVNGRHLTNLGTFRAYLMAYLRTHPEINQEMILLVRHLQPTTNGLPMEIYVFTKDVAWVKHESVQADIFDHILAVVPQFDLRVFQNPGGHDLARIGLERSAY